MSNYHLAIEWLFKQLKSQSTHSSIILFAIATIAAKAAGIDLVEITDGMGKLALSVAALSAAAKVIIPDAPSIPPNSVVITPDAAAPTPSVPGDPQ